MTERNIWLIFFERFQTTYPGFPPHNFIEAHVTTCAQNHDSQVLNKNLFLFALFFRLLSDLALNWNTLVRKFPKHSLNKLNIYSELSRKRGTSNRALSEKKLQWTGTVQSGRYLKDSGLPLWNLFKRQLLPWAEGLIFTYKEDKPSPTVLNLILTNINGRYWTWSLWMNSSVLPEDSLLRGTPLF